MEPGDFKKSDRVPYGLKTFHLRLKTSSENIEFNSATFSLSPAVIFLGVIHEFEETLHYLESGLLRVSSVFA